ncbi:MAG: hypothetical protein IRZ05_04950 [Micromonosporaceae bacterium]|nr:hypothetical protein [Micromonosporaceae bacterium]
MKSWIDVTIETVLVYQEVAVRVGMLLGRYMDDPTLVGIVATHVATGWLRARRRSAAGPLSTVEHWWNAYVESVEATVGGVDCATEDGLARAWTAQARRLLQGSATHPSRPGSPAPISLRS